jgi:two-component system CheB/CheR fusion protein
VIQLATNSGAILSAAFQARIPPSDDLTGDVERGWRQIVHDLESSNRELLESNEKLIAALEELQSLNMALQSVNDALHRTNVELRGEVETVRTQALDMERMLSAVDVGTILVDNRLTLRNFNAMALRFMSLSRADIGKPIGHIRHDFGLAPLVELCRQALLTGDPVDRVVTSSCGESILFIAREVSLESRDPGLILTFGDIRGAPEPESHRLA